MDMEHKAVRLIFWLGSNLAGGGAVPMVISRSATKMEYTPCTVNVALRYGCLPYAGNFLSLRRAASFRVGCPQACASVLRIAEDIMGVPQ